MFAVLVPCNYSIDIYSSRTLKLKFRLNSEPGNRIECIEISKDWRYLVLLINCKKPHSHHNILIYDMVQRKYLESLIDVESKIPGITYIHRINISLDNKILVLQTRILNETKAIFINFTALAKLEIYGFANNCVSLNPHCNKLSPVEPVYFTINKKVLSKISYTGEVLGRLDNVSSGFYEILDDGSVLYLTDRNKIYKVDKNLENNIFLKDFDLDFDPQNLDITPDGSEIYYRKRGEGTEIIVYDVKTSKSNKYQIPTECKCYIFTVTKYFFVLEDSSNKTYWIDRKTNNLTILELSDNFFNRMIIYRENLWSQQILNLLPGIRVLHTLQRSYEKILSPDNITVIIEILLASIISIKDNQLLLLANFLRRYTSREKDEELDLLRSDKKALDEKITEYLIF